MQCAYPIIFICIISECVCHRNTIVCFRSIKTLLVIKTACIAEVFKMVLLFNQFNMLVAFFGKMPLKIAPEKKFTGKNMRQCSFSAARIAYNSPLFMCMNCKSDIIKNFIAASVYCNIGKCNQFCLLLLHYFHRSILLMDKNKKSSLFIR